jgi:hypothetical protein
MVEVFKTNVEQENQAVKLLADLTKRFPAFVINFDLEDSDKILRVKGKNIEPKQIIEVLNSNGLQGQILD